MVRGPVCAPFEVLVVIGSEFFLIEGVRTADRLVVGVPCGLFGLAAAEGNDKPEVPTGGGDTYGFVVADGVADVVGVLGICGVGVNVSFGAGDSDVVSVVDSEADPNAVDDAAGDTDATGVVFRLNFDVASGNSLA